MLPIYLDLARGSPVLQAFGGPVILLVWLYVMANVIVFGAEINWWMARRRERRMRSELPNTRRRPAQRVARELRASCASWLAFQASPSSATVLDSASRHEDGVEPETLATARIVGDRAFERAGAPELESVGRQRDELTDVARRALRLTFEPQ